MGQGDSARDFDPSESMENVGILDVFPIFHTARLGQKIRRSPQLPLCGVALVLFMENRFPIFKGTNISKNIFQKSAGFPGILAYTVGSVGV